MPICVALGCRERGVHVFPKDPNLKKLWEQALRRINFVASRHSRLCRNHFKESDYMGESAYTGRPQVHKFLKKGVIPSIFPWTRRKSDTVSERAQISNPESSCLETLPENTFVKHSVLQTVWIKILDIEVATGDDTIPSSTTASIQTESRLSKEMPRCIVTNCERLTNNFSLPMLRARRDVWLFRSGNANLVYSTKESYRNKKICHIHFHEKCFLKENRLHKWAVPSLDLPDYSPTGGDEDTCFIQNTEAKPRRSPKDRKLKRSSYVEYSPVRKVRTQERINEHQNIVHETLHIKDEIIFPAPLEYTMDNLEDLQTPSTSTCQEDIKIPLFQEAEMKKETEYSGHSYCIKQEPEAVNESELNEIEIKQEPFENICVNEKKDDSDDFMGTPLAITEAATETISNLHPSKGRYERAYKQFMDWRMENKVESFSENVLMAYFGEMCKEMKPNTLWCVYLMLRSTLLIRQDIDLTKYIRVKAFLKRNCDGYRPKKSKTFTITHINKFLKEAPDDKYLLQKVVLVIGICGACRKHEMIQMTIDDIEDLGRAALIKIFDAKTKKQRSFTITGEFYEIYKKYSAFRPSPTNERRFFLNSRRKFCTRQPVGLNKVGGIPKQIATYLGLKNPELYTAHCYRQSSATILEEAGGEITGLKRHGGWKSTAVAENYIDYALSNKMKVSDAITNSINNNSSESSSAAPSSPLSSTLFSELKFTPSASCTHPVDNLQNMPSSEGTIFDKKFAQHSVSKQTPISFIDCSELEPACGLEIEQDPLEKTHVKEEFDF